MTMQTMIKASGLGKTFILHAQGGIRLPVLQGVDLEVAAGECVALHGPSGAGKSTLLRSLYANYRPQAGSILVWHQGGFVDLVAAEPRQILAVRKTTIGFVSQFLRVIPRIATLDLVTEPLQALGEAEAAARDRAAMLLTRLRIPERLWHVPPATFSGGEQQRVNLARSLVVGYPILLLDEPTAALDADNRQTVIELINEAKQSGSSVVGIFHDREVSEAVATRIYQMRSYEAAA